MATLNDVIVSPGNIAARSADIYVTPNGYTGHQYIRVYVRLDPGNDANKVYDNIDDRIPFPRQAYAIYHIGGLTPEKTYAYRIGAYDVDENGNVVNFVWWGPTVAPTFTTEKETGIKAYIYLDREWREAVPYIFLDGDWRKVTPYIY